MNVGGIDVGTAITLGKDVLIKMLQDIIVELRPRMSLEDLQMLYTKYLDQIILKEEYDENIKYIGGEFNLNYVDVDHYDCDYKLFFMDKEKKITEMSTKSKPFAAYYLDSKTREELKETKTIKFEIPEPSLEVRDKYNREKFVKVK